MKKILAISGSTRKNATSEIILKTISDVYKNKLDVNLYNQIDKLPHYNADLDKDSPPTEVLAFRQLIADSDGVIICTPEYVFSLPGTLKNALEWTVSTTLFSYKPFAFIIASTSGEKAFESLDLIMKTLLQQPVNDNCKLLIQGSRAKINKVGSLSDAQTFKNIKKVVESLIEEMNSSNTGRAI